MDRDNEEIENIGRDKTSKGPSGRSRRRAAVACGQCSLRKVRCNVSLSGIPCENCSRDDVMCKVFPRKKRRTRQSKTAAPSTPSATSMPDGVNPPSAIDTAAMSGLKSTSPVLEMMGDTQILGIEVIPTDSITSLATPSDEEEPINAYVEAFDPSPRSSKDGPLGLFYFGDRQGLGGFMFDICEGPGALRDCHYIMPVTSTFKPTLEEDAYLKSIGAFNVPSLEICDDLFLCYFANVHQFLPIVDAEELLTEFSQTGMRNLSLLLIWSMFFASSNFLDSETLRNTGYPSRKAIKRDTFRRAKALYDCGYERDNITLIQSVILMGLWYNDTTDRFGAWHWTGVAISLSQTIGLHRQFRQEKSQRRMSDRKQKVCRRVWWTCFVRDRWLSLSKGQAVRIDLAECDVAMPVVSDIVEEIEAMDPVIRSKYASWNEKCFAGLWLKLVDISAALGSVLDLHREIEGRPPGVDAIQACEDEISQCHLDDSEGLVSEDRAIRLWASQLQLLHEATTVVLFRPYIFDGPKDQDLTISKQWQQKSQDKARSAAARTNGILERLLEDNLVRNMKSMAITSLIPAMQIHLLDCKSSNSLVRQFGSQKLQICMLAMAELRNTYWGADFVFEIFQRAHDKILRSSTGSLGRQLVSTSPWHQKTYPILSTPVSETTCNHFEACYNAQNHNNIGGEEQSDVYTTGETIPSTAFYDADIDESYRFLLENEDFSNLLLDMV